MSGRELTGTAEMAAFDRRNAAWFFDKLMQALIFIGGISAIIFVAGIFVFITKEGLGFILDTFDFAEFFGSTRWRAWVSPMAQPTHLPLRCTTMRLSSSPSVPAAPSPRAVRMAARARPSRTVRKNWLRTMTSDGNPRVTG